MKTKTIAYLSFIVLLATVLISSCKVATNSDGGVATGEDESNDSIIVNKTKYRGSQQTEWEVRFKKMPDGTKVREGISKRYLQTGKLAETINYIDGKKEGLRTFYYQNGSVWKEFAYVKGKRHGTFKLFDRKGNLNSQLDYYMGFPGVGLKQFYQSGKEKEDPKLVLIQSNEIKETGYYKIVANLTGDGAKRIKRVDFYESNLIDGKYFNKDSKGLTLLTSLSSTKGELKIPVKRGEFVDSDINIIAYIITKDGGLPLIIQKKVHIAVRGV
ncbi:MAG: hypothetical protein JW717_02235 [Marinilabiliaceae bacterium]|nr:hypothetical protein [Marinilabiliaceae bacterium]